MKITADIFERFEGSEDARAAQGGGDAGLRCIARKTNSEWLIRAYTRAMSNRYEEVFTFKRVA